MSFKSGTQPTDQPTKQTNKQGSLAACLLFCLWPESCLLTVPQLRDSDQFEHSKMLSQHTFWLLRFLIMVSFTYISLLHFLTNWVSTWAIYKITQIYASHNVSVAVVQFQNCIFCLNLLMEKIKSLEIIQLSECDSMSLEVCFCWACFRSCEVIYYVMFAIRNIYSYI